LTSRSVRGLAVLWVCATACRLDSSGIVPRLDAGRDVPAIDAPAIDAPERRELRGQDRQGRETVIGVEGDCLDGVDDDGDQQIDCEDPDCAGYECVAAAPPSMTGYYRVRESAWKDPVSPCADGGTPEVYPTEVASGACTPCACGTFGGAACGYPPIHSWDADDCSSGTGTDVTATLGKSGCVVGTASGQVALKVVGSAAPTNMGSCAASGGVAQHPPPFAKQLEACGSSEAGGGCDGKVCVPRAQTGAVTRLCHRLSSGTCGAGWVAVVGHGAWKDERTCTPCACTPSGVTCTGGKYTLYGNNQSCDGSGCAQPETIALNDCRSFSAALSTPYSVKAEAAKAGGGTCSPSGGQAAGSVTSTPITYCCPP